MRRSILIVLVLLLPLRVWAGLDMATQMGAAQLDVPATVVAAAEEMPSDCPMSHGGAVDSNGSQCQVCELCAPVGGGSMPDRRTATGNRSEAPLGGLAQFTSADRRPALDPPRL